MAYETATSSGARSPILPTFTLAGTPPGASVTLAWQAPIFGDVQAYTVYRSDGFHVTLWGAPPQTTYTDSNPVAGATYFVTSSVPGDNGVLRESAPSTTAILHTSSTVTVTCPASVPYNGTAQAPCSATVTGAGGLNQPLQVTYSNNTNAGTGTATASASFAGNANYSASSGSATFSITPAPQSITFTTNAPTSEPYNGQFTVAATGGASGNPVTFTSSGVCTNSGATYTTYTMTSGTGKCSVIANQAGNSNYSAAPQVTQTVSATLASQTITFPTIPTQNGPGSVTLTATASSGLTVSYTVTSGPATVSGNTLTTTGAGSVTVKASQAGNTNYSAAAPVSQTFTVTANASGLNGKNCNGEYTGTYNGNLTVSSGQSCTFTNGGVTGNLTQTGGTVVLENSSFVKGILQTSAGTLSISNSSVSGNLQITGGALSISNSSVGGNLLITGGGTFSIGPTVSIGGNLQIQNLPASAGTNQVCGASVQGILEVLNSGTVTLIGSPPGCAGNIVGGNLQVQNNTAATAIYNNTVGGNLTDESNTAATAIYNNTVKGNLTDQSNTAASQVFNNAVTAILQCSGDSAISGGGNTAKSKQGQCAKF
jgi:hypothetical protein